MLKNSLHLTTLAVAITGASLLSSPVLFAKQSDRHITNARVISATPVYDEVRINQPQEECWLETVKEPVRSSRNSKTPEIFGALIGAAVGHQFGGSKRSQHAAAAAGAVLGTSVGHDWDNKRRDTSNTRVSRVERCQTVDNYRTEQKLAGYDVTYRYHGDVYQTFTQDHPGDTLRVNVSVTPVE